MFYRRKVILALIQTFGGELEKIRLHKFLFLISRQQTQPVYDFIPYKFGCFSYTVNADVLTMEKYGLLLIEDDTNSIRKLDQTDYIRQLKYSDIKILKELKNTYGRMSNEELIKYTYHKFPYYAINSEILNKLFNDKELEHINRLKPKNNNITLFTIGYEGKSVEEYLNQLIKNNIKLLLDVRKNPFSMKFGFSKNQLSNYCENIGIKYLHLPEAGIESEMRQNLSTQEDYEHLFLWYQKNILNNNKSIIYYILSLLENHRRVALTCFEADIYRCHRKYLAEAITNLPSFKYQLLHI
jgi:uncharacterized protein (DUF488 family)